MKSVADVIAGVIEFRHAAHRMPEMAGEEFKTQALIRNRLRELGIEALPPFLQTDTVVILHGSRPGPNVTLRADIDALAVKEETGAPFCSQRPGYMHACGHDTHNAMLMGAAEILATADFAGSIRLVWQPGEECKAMARELVAAGVLDTPRCDMAAAIHVSPGIPAGTISTRIGAMMSGNNHFKVIYRGRGGHGSRLDLALNPVTAAAAAVTQLQGVVNNRINPQRSGVVSICEFHGGTLSNVIPDEAYFTGTLRYLDNATGEELRQSFTRVCQSVASAWGMECEVIMEKGYLPTLNDARAFAIAERVCKNAAIPFVTQPESDMGSEDFAFFLAKTPGVYMNLGIGDQPPCHNCRMLPPDEVLATGVRVLVDFALEALRELQA